MRISDWSSDVCSSDLQTRRRPASRAWSPTARHRSPSHAGSETSARRQANDRFHHLHHVIIGMSGAQREADSRRAFRHRWRTDCACQYPRVLRSEEHTSELQSLMRISYAVFCLKKKTKNNTNTYPV